MSADIGTDTVVAVMDQYAEPVAAAESLSGLSHVDIPKVQGTAANASTVTLVIKPVTGLLMIRAGADAGALSKALEAHCAIALSGRLDSIVNDDICIRWMSPDCWLLSCPLQQCHGIEMALRNALTGHIAIVDVSGGYTCLQLRGKNARDVLMKSTGYDTHPENLFPGKVVNTTFAKAQVTLRCLEIAATGHKSGSAESCYELIVRRSFSDYLWMWIQRASTEYGLLVVR